MSITKEEYMNIINQTKKKNFTLNDTVLNNKLHEIKLQEQHNKLKEQELYILQTKIKEYDIKLEEQYSREKEYQVKENEFKIKIEEFNSNQNKIQQENNNKEHLLKIKENEMKETYIKLKDYEIHLNQIKTQQEKEINAYQNKIKQEHQSNISQLKLKEQEFNVQQNKTHQEHESNINQLKLKEQELHAVQNKIQQEYQVNISQLKTKEQDLQSKQNKMQQENQTKTNDLQTKEQELYALQNKIKQEHQSNITQLKIKEQEYQTNQNKMQQEHQSNVNQLKIKEQEHQSNISQLKIKEQEYERKLSQLKIKEQEYEAKSNELRLKENSLNAYQNKIKQEYDANINQLKLKEQEQEVKIKKKEQDLTIRENADLNFLPHITIIKIPCMMYISYIIQDELIKMGWKCSIIDKTEINNYIYVNHFNHYFLFLLANQIHKNVIDYKRYILYQLEQNVNDELSINYKQLHETSQLQSIYDNATLLIDYSEINVNVTKKYYSNEFKLMNVPAIHNTMYETNKNELYDYDHEYDIIFIGQINKRRKNILDKLKEKYKVLIVNDVYGEELKQLCNKSNICLNIHYYKNAILERVRLNEMMDYGIKIISEKPCDKDICNYYSVHFIEMINDNDNLNELIDTIEKIKNTKPNHPSYNLKELYSIFIEDFKIFQNICILPKRIAVITANYGNYDTIKEVNIMNKEYFDWFLFTDIDIDIDIQNKTYIVIHYPLNFEYAHNNDFNRLNAKYIKCQALNIDILKKYEYIIWTDSSLQIKNNNLVRDILNILDNNNDKHKNKNKNKSDLYFYHHYRRNNIMDEYKISKPLSKYHNHKMEEQIKKYRYESFLDNYLYECGIFIIKNNEKNIKIMNDWWEENITYSYQDQLSLPYVLWKNNAKPFLLNEKSKDKLEDKLKGSVWDNKLFGIIQNHN